MPRPRFYSPEDGTLIRATAPMQRLSIDFKGPLPTSPSSYRYLLTIIDEYSRFPMAYPCRDISSQTVIRCLTDVFSTFGIPSYIHSDRGQSFLSEEIKQFLLRIGILSSRTTPYNPRGNCQCEWNNGVIWNNITLTQMD